MCYFCGNPVDKNEPLTRYSSCPTCGKDLHSCMNCKFYSETAHNKCVEPKAEFQRSRDKANFCDYFVFSERASGSGSGKARADALRRLDDLFKK